MIIQSLLDTDLYKFTMMQVVLHQFPDAMVEYRFKCRNDGVSLLPYVDQIREQIRQFCQLRLSKEELHYLRSLPYLTSDFVEFLRLFSASEEFITVDGDKEFEIIIRGPWLHTILFEVPVLAIVNEVYFRNTQPEPDYVEGRRRLQEKIHTVLTHPEGDQFRFFRFWHASAFFTGLAA